MNTSNLSQSDNASQLLSVFGLKHFVMLLRFNDGSAFVLSILNDDLTIETPNDFTAKVIDSCNELTVLSEKLKALKTGYHIIRPHSECIFEFFAPGKVSTEANAKIDASSIKKFEVFCIHFVDRFLELIMSYNPSYRFSFILTHKPLRDAVISQGYEKEITLTEREQECIWLAMQGKSAKEIGQKLKISNFTVQKHFSNIRDLFNGQSLRAIALECIHRGIIGKVGFYRSKNQLNSVESQNKLPIYI